MNPMSKQTFRCYVYREGNGYYADCLDLTLLTKRDTMQEAMTDLQELILGYLESAYAHGDEKELLPRRAPLYRWLEFYKQLLLHTVRALFTGRFVGFLTYEVSPVEQQGLVYA